MGLIGYNGESMWGYLGLVGLFFDSSPLISKKIRLGGLILWDLEGHPSLFPTVRGGKPSYFMG